MVKQIRSEQGDAIQYLAGPLYPRASNELGSNPDAVPRCPKVVCVSLKEEDVSLPTASRVMEAVGQNTSSQIALCTSTGSLWVELSQQPCHCLRCDIIPVQMAYVIVIKRWEESVGLGFKTMICYFPNPTDLSFP